MNSRLSILSHPLDNQLVIPMLCTMFGQDNTNLEVMIL